MAEIKCPCGLRNYMEEEDCKKTVCNACCPLTKPQTRADKIRAMSDEEITEFVFRNGINTLCDIICGGECNAIASFKKSGDEACKEIVMKWLKQSVKEEQ